MPDVIGQKKKKKIDWMVIKFTFLDVPSSYTFIIFCIIYLPIFIHFTKFYFLDDFLNY